jgi:23S rRNA (uracil1939-C5)-methyltransferase
VSTGPKPHPRSLPHAAQAPDSAGDARRVHCPHGAPRGTDPATLDAPVCGGCTRLDEPYGAQRAAKRTRVATAFARYGELAQVDVAEVDGAASIEAYRTRAKFVTGPGGAIGLYAQGGAHRAVDLPECRVLAPAVARGVAAVRALVAEGALRTEADGGALAAIDVREVVGTSSREPSRAMVTLVLREGREPTVETLEQLSTRLVARDSVVAGVAVSTARAGSPQLLGGGLRVLAGEPALPDRIGAGGVYQLAAHGSFIQAHRGQAARLHEAVHAALVDALGTLDSPRIVDLYAGSGALGLALAERGARVLCVESFSPAVAHTLTAARRQQLDDVHAIAGDAALVAQDLAQSGTRVDAVVVNPPRRGCAPEVRAALAALAPAVAVYVSCDPETLARDLAHLARLGYATERAQPWDMIPLTDEVETLAVLHRAPPPPPRVLFADDTLVAVEKAAHEPTTPQGEHAGSLLARVRRLPGCAEAVPIHRLDAGTSGVCLFARRAADVAPWQRALGASDAEKRYTALVRGVIRAKGSIARPLPDEGVMREARTRYRRVAVLRGHALVEARPDEGRTHQIRRHLAALGHPVVGDARYGHAPSNRHFSEKFGLDRPFLHCGSIALEHPHTGAALRLEAPLAGDLACVLDRLGAPVDALPRPV